jgi:hypothetical protein
VNPSVREIAVRACVGIDTARHFPKQDLGTVSKLERGVDPSCKENIYGTFGMTALESRARAKLSQYLAYNHAARVLGAHKMIVGVHHIAVNVRDFDRMLRLHAH